MALDLAGTLIQVLPETTGEGTNGPWRKTSFVIEVESGKFKKKVCFTVWGDKIDEIKRFSPGNQVTVHFDIESRSFNDRWYTDARMWKIEGTPSVQSGGSTPSNNDPDPFGAPSAQDDDLPF